MLGTCHNSPFSRILCYQLTFQQTTDTSKVDICAKRGVSRPHYMLIGHIRRQYNSQQGCQTAAANLWPFVLERVINSCELFVSPTMKICLWWQQLLRLILGTYAKWFCNFSSDLVIHRSASFFFSVWMICSELLSIPPLHCLKLHNMLKTV